MPVRVVAYDPRWPAQFSELSGRLDDLLRRWLVRPVEHVGSTAVPGLSAKPVIDIAAAVTSLTTAQEALSVLQRNGWVHWASDPNRSWRLWLLYPRPEARTHHLYLIQHDDPHLHELVAFRDRLRADATTRHRYGELKQALAQRFSGDREAYTAAKTAFVADVLATGGLQIQPRNR